MKSAEEWLKEFKALDTRMDDEVASNNRWTNEIKQIQLDAMREGMRRAAGVCEQHEKNQASARTDDKAMYAAEQSRQDKQAILTAAEQLTLDSL